MIWQMWAIGFWTIILRSFNKMIKILAIYFHNLKPVFQNYEKMDKILTTKLIFKLTGQFTADNPNHNHTSIK